MNSRIAKIKSQLIEQKLDAILISSPANLFYLSGFVCLSPLEREAYLLVTKTNIFLVTSPLYAGDTHLPGEIKLEKTIHSSHEEVVSGLLEQNRIKSLGIEEDFLTVAQFHDLQTDGVDFKRVSLSILRIQKDDEEVQNIENACKIGDDAFKFVVNKIKPGVMETEIATELELFVRKKGATMSFPTIIGFGKNAAIPHHITSPISLKQNNFVLLDFGVKVNNYCSDMTRTVYFGNPSMEDKKIYATVLEAQKRAIDYIQKTHTLSAGRQESVSPDNQTVGQSDSPSVPKISASEADKIARDYIVSQGFTSFPHTLGHGIGIEVHENPSLSSHSKNTLSQGMVFSVEPGIYLQGRTGVRIEDLMVVGEKETRVLTKAPKELIVL